MAEQPHVRVEVVPAPCRRQVTVLIRDRVGVAHLGVKRFDLLLGGGQELRSLVPLRVARGIRQDVDTPDDLRLAAELGVGPRTAAALRSGPSQT